MKRGYSTEKFLSLPFQYPISNKPLPSPSDNLSGSEVSHESLEVCLERSNGRRSS